MRILCLISCFWFFCKNASAQGAEPEVHLMPIEHLLVTAPAKDTFGIKVLYVKKCSEKRLKVTMTELPSAGSSPIVAISVLGTETGASCNEKDKVEIAIVEGRFGTHYIPVEPSAHEPALRMVGYDASGN